MPNQVSMDVYSLQEAEYKVVKSPGFSFKQRVFRHRRETRVRITDVEYIQKEFLVLSVICMRVAAEARALNKTAEIMYDAAQDIKAPSITPEVRREGTRKMECECNHKLENTKRYI